MTSVTCFVGCSYTSGYGFERERYESCFWPVLLHSNVEQLDQTEYVNLGIEGASNELIFTTAVHAMLEHCPKYIFVQWSSYPRINFLLGMETYASKQLFAWDCKPSDHNLHKITYSSEYLSKIRDRFLSLEHQHNQISNIVHFVNTLIKLAIKLNCKIFFINGMCSWDQNYFVKLDNVLPSEYTHCTQKFLDVDTRSDEEIFVLYNKLHNDYQQHGGIQPNYWLNLYNSLLSNKIDTNQDQVHPGQKSNRVFFDFLSSALIRKLSS